MTRGRPGSFSHWLGHRLRPTAAGFFSTRRFTVSDNWAPFLVQWSMRSCLSIHLGRMW